MMNEHGKSDRRVVPTKPSNKGAGEPPQGPARPKPAEAVEGRRLAKSNPQQRTNYKRLLEAVRKHQADVVLVWRYDRFARSTQALIFALKEFHSLGVDFISFQENINTTTPQGELIFTIMASLVQFESSLIGARTKAGKVCSSKKPQEEAQYL